MASKAYTGITPAIWACIQATSQKEHGTTYDPPNGDSGTATTKTSVGTVTMSYVLADETLTYTIEHKPGIVTDGEIWGGIDKTVNGCKNS